MTTLFTSLLLVEERLLEASYFAQQLKRAGFDDIHYKLNAFLSAARSVTFLLQKEMHDVPGWPEWWAARRREMAADAAMRFFLLQRNHSQKAGRVRVVGTRRGRGRGWSYRFVSGDLTVPPELHQRDIADCCTDHVAKLARLTLACIKAFPFHSNPRRAMTPDGVQALALDLDAVDAALQFPHGWTRGLEPAEDRIRVLGEHFDGPDELLIAKLAWPRLRKPRKPQTPSEVLGESLLTHLVIELEKVLPRT